MRVLAIASVENSDNIEAQIAKQTVQPYKTYIYVDETPAQGINPRRKRIALNHDKLRDAVRYETPDLVWQLEGDCDLPDDCLERLLANYEALDDGDFGYVSGIQVGRHGLYCLGAWRGFSDTEFYSIDYKLEGIQPVDATGFYCLLAPTDVWLSGKCSWTDEPYGPDVVWSLSINKSKYCDMSLTIGHIVKNGIIRPEHMSTCNVRFYKDTDRWKFKQL